MTVTHEPCPLNLSDNSRKPNVKSALLALRLKLMHAGPVVVRDNFDIPGGPVRYAWSRMAEAEMRMTLCSSTTWCIAKSTGKEGAESPDADHNPAHLFWFIILWIVTVLLGAYTIRKFVGRLWWKNGTEYSEKHNHAAKIIHRTITDKSAN